MFAVKRELPHRANANGGESLMNLCTARELQVPECSCRRMRWQ